MLRLDEHMVSAWSWWAKQDVVRIINRSNKILYVIQDDRAGSAIGAVDPGRHAEYHLSSDTIRFTISYYGDTRDLEYLCTKQVFNRGKVLRVQADVCRLGQKDDKKTIPTTRRKNIQKEQLE
jgi:hypothetical protein